LLLRENQFQIAHCLKSFGSKLFFVYTLKLLTAPFWHFCTQILVYIDKHRTCFRDY